MNDGGGMMGGSFSSPVVATIAGQRQLVVQGRQNLAGIDIETGRVYWSQEIKAFRGMNIFTPVVKGNRLFTSAYGGLSQAWDVEKSGTTFAVKPAWEHKAEGYMSTPVVVSGKIFMHLRNQRLTCLDFATGTQLWISEEKFGEYWSLIAQGNKILALDAKGSIRLFRANPGKFELLAERKLGSAEMWAHVARAGSTLVVRELDALVSYSWE